MPIKDSVVMLTGGAIRVGRQVALHLAGLGAHLSFSYLPGEPGPKTQAEVEALGVRCLATPLDVRDPAGIRAWVAATKAQFGRIDVLINNASVITRRPFLEMTEADWDSSVDVNVKGVFLCSQAVAPTMLAQGGGVIVNVTDLSAFKVWPGFAHHAVGKAGVIQLTRYMAKELGPRIRVNAIAPGPILPPDGSSPAETDKAMAMIIMDRMGTPQDAARLMVFLIENDFLTGGVYHVDGGSALV
ncbi:MAG: SDR family oxidoreductase [Anaerolineales bacterium]|nr:SDR family oxidoreductase [Anaerolineales bacterium]